MCVWYLCTEEWICWLAAQAGGGDGGRMMVVVMLVVWVPGERGAAQVRRRKRPTDARREAENGRRTTTTSLLSASQSDCRLCSVCLKENRMSAGNWHFASVPLNISSQWDMRSSMRAFFCKRRHWFTPSTAGLNTSSRVSRNAPSYAVPRNPDHYSFHFSPFSLSSYKTYVSYFTRHDFGTRLEFVCACVCQLNSDTRHLVDVRQDLDSFA